LRPGVGNHFQECLRGIGTRHKGSGDLMLKPRQALRRADQLVVGIQVLLKLRARLFGERSLCQLTLHLVRDGMGDTQELVA